jgi:hypothetical protein
MHWNFILLSNIFLSPRIVGTRARGGFTCWACGVAPAHPMPGRAARVDQHPRGTVQGEPRRGARVGSQVASEPEGRAGPGRRHTGRGCSESRCLPPSSALAGLFFFEFFFSNSWETTSLMVSPG